jgi:hypothetical protein
MKKELVVLILILAATGYGTPAQSGVKESIFVHTDREVYISGENMYFKVYLYDPVVGKLTDKSKFAYILLYDSNNVPVFRECLNLSGGIGDSFLYLPDTLKTGNYLFIAYTNWMRNFGDSTFFKKEIYIANRFDDDVVGSTKGLNTTGYNLPDVESNSIQVLPGPGIYHTREKVRLQLSVPVKTDANISVSVSEKNPLPGFPAQCYSASGTCNEYNYLREEKGFIIGGSITNPKSVSGVLVILSTPDTIANIMATYTDSDGRFYFQLDRYYLNRELFIHVAEPDPAYECELLPDDKFKCGISFNPSAKNIPDDFLKFIHKSQVITKINKTYLTRSPLDAKLPGLSPLTRRVYFKPDMKIFTADYIPLKNFNEIVRETLPGARIRKDGNNFAIEILDIDKKVFMEDPAIIINGILVNNLNDIIGFGSDKIISIELVFHKRAYGSQIFNGIVSIITRDLKNDVFPIRPYLRIQPVHFLPSGQFPAKEYTAPEMLTSRTPDFRQLLFWDPSVWIENDKPAFIEFYTSDNTGRYVIRIEGFDADGRRIHYVSDFDVLNTFDNR